MRFRSSFPLPSASRRRTHSKLNRRRLPGYRAPMYPRKTSAASKRLPGELFSNSIRFSKDFTFFPDLSASFLPGFRDALKQVVAKMAAIRGRHFCVCVSYSSNHGLPRQLCLRHPCIRLLHPCRMRQLRNPRYLTGICSRRCLAGSALSSPDIVLRVDQVCPGFCVLINHRPQLRPSRSTMPHSPPSSRSMMPWSIG